MQQARVFLIGDEANEENEEEDGWRSHEYRSTSFMCCMRYQKIGFKDTEQERKTINHIALLVT